METDNLKAMEQNAVNAAIRWAKTDMGYPMMVKSVNDYMIASTADRAFKDDPDAVRHHRRTLAMQIDLDAFFSVSSEQEQRLRDALMKIAEDGDPRQYCSTHTMSNMDANELKNEAIRAAIRWAKTGVGYFRMEDAVNKYIEAIGANRAIGNDPEAIRLGRKAAALRIDIESIHALTKDQEQRLHDTLMTTVEDGVPRQRRGFRR